MKFRTDFVTNSSSANYILDVALVADNGNGARLNLAVSPETCWCEDGDITAEDIGLYCGYDKNKNVTFDGKPVRSVSSVDELVDLIAGTAYIEGFIPGEGREWKPIYIDPDMEVKYYEDTDDIAEWITDEGGETAETPDEAAIIITDKSIDAFPGFEGKVLSEKDFILRYDGDMTQEVLMEGDLDDVSVAETCPKSVASFKNRCHEAGLTMDNLDHIRITNAKWGSGDSAMWVEKDILDDYKDRYLSAETDEEKTAITKEAVESMLSKPVVEVNDNEGCLDDEMQIVLEDNDEAVIREEVMKYFRGEGRSYWMGQNSSIYRIDVKADTIEREYVLVLEAD